MLVQFPNDCLEILEVAVCVDIQTIFEPFAEHFILATLLFCFGQHQISFIGNLIGSNPLRPDPIDQPHQRIHPPTGEPLALIGQFDIFLLQLGRQIGVGQDI